MPTKKKSASEPSQALSILMKEYDALREMYNQSVHNGQTMFNYYLTLITVVLGGITFIIQPGSGILLAKTSVGLLLVFLAVVGSFYFSSLASNAAHSARYALGINEIRRHIFETYAVELPPIFKRFNHEPVQEEVHPFMKVAAYIIPVGTLPLFVATVNSLTWGAIVAMVYYGTISHFSLLAFGLPGILALVVTFVIYSIYARFLYQITLKNMHIRIGH